jgi:hypothetical protein
MPDGDTIVSSSSIFREALRYAERRFGERTRKLKIKVEARDNEVPETVADGSSACVVYYARKAKRDLDRVRFQLAHEAIHVLSGALTQCNLY